jgi:hypothetical protein
MCDKGPTMIRSTVVQSLFALSVVFAFAACDSKDDAHSHDGEAAHSHDGDGGHAHDKGDKGDKECSCSKGKDGGTVWCESCNMGYIDGEKSNDKAKVEEAIAKK